MVVYAEKPGNLHTHTHTHTHGCLCKIKLFPIFLFMMAMPTFAAVDIAADANSADCDHDVLKTYSDSANLEADWTANQITLHWYNDDSEINVSGTTSATCTYDGSITLPATNPTKQGYTFTGWQVRAAVAPAQTLFGSLNVGIDGSNRNYSSADGSFSVEFDYGTVYGESSCNSITPETDEYGMYISVSGDTMNTNTTGVKCWCHITGLGTNGDIQTDDSLKWAYNTYYDNPSQCANYCATNCSYSLANNSERRARMYGQIKYTTNCEAINTETNCVSSYNTDDYSMCLWWGGSCHSRYVSSCSDIDNEDACAISEDDSKPCEWKDSWCGHIVGNSG